MQGSEQQDPDKTVQISRMTGSFFVCISPDQALFFQPKYIWHLLEAPNWDTSNEYQ